MTMNDESNVFVQSEALVEKAHFADGFIGT